MTDTSSWKEAGFRFGLECSSRAAENLRSLSIEGLLMLPRVGIGVGGLLLGLLEGERIRIIDTVPIPCLHATGPSFVLSPEETAAAIEMVRTTSPLSVVGWYCSKPRGPGPIAFTDVDRTLFGLICPEPWQVMILIKPSTVEHSRSVICYRDPDGNVVAGEDRPLIPETAPRGADRIHGEPAIVDPPVAIPAPIETPLPLKPPSFTERQTDTTGNVWIALSIVLVAGATGLLLYGRW